MKLNIEIWWQVAIFSLSSTKVLAQVNFVNITAATFPELSSTCVSVLNQAVACSPLFMRAEEGRFEDDATLNAICTTTCTSAIATWQRRVIGACGTARFNDGKGNLVLPQIFPEIILETYSLLCLQHDGKFCNAVLRDKAGVDPDRQLPTATAVPNLNCEDCVLKGMSLHQQMQLRSASDMATRFSSLTASCGKTTYTFTPITTTTYLLPAGSSTIATPKGPDPAPTPAACVGSSYTVKSGDTCQSIAKANGISTFSLLQTNNLAGYCTNFPAAGKALCISTAHKCKTWTVKAGDTCGSIADANNLIWTQVVTWNRDLGLGCNNIADHVGYEVCVSQPGGNWINPSPEPTPTPTVDPTRTGTPLDQLPLATFTGNGSYSTWIWGNGTRKDCDRYATGLELAPNNTCAQAATGFNVKLEELLEWNPSLKGVSPCALNDNIQYCVQRLQARAKNTTEYCIWHTFAMPGQTCGEFIDNWGVTVGQFASWNPTVGPNCTTFQTGFEYCVQVRHFKQPGYISTCNKFVLANETSFLDYPCEIIETKFGLSHSRFVAWNPAIGTNCREVYQGYDYCVSIPNYRPTYTTPTPRPTYTGFTSTDWLSNVPTVKPTP